MTSGLVHCSVLVSWGTLPLIPWEPKFTFMNLRGRFVFLFCWEDLVGVEACRGSKGSSSGWENEGSSGESMLWRSKTV